MSQLAGTRAIVVGASRGFGRGIAEALIEAGADVHALSRSDSSDLVRATGGRIRTITADATDGRPFVEAYARRQGRTVEQFLGGAPLTPADVGAAVVRLVRDRALDEQVAFRLDGGGLVPLHY